ncbi:MAG: DUF302 domain-containing protein [Pararhodobacter sp.]|nr:DUF302 domain-containing protein [Pararhodobacter sp.]
MTATNLIPVAMLRRLSALMLAVALMAAASVMPQAAAADAGEMPQMVQLVQSPKNFPETVDAFRTEVANAGWSLLNENNMAGVLSARGYTIDPVIIFDVCSGRFSAQILEHDEARPVSAFMPCRVSIYQTSEGDVFIARMNTAAFAAMMDPMVAEVMIASDSEISQIIDAAIR